MAALQALLDLVIDFNYSIDGEGKYFSKALSYNYVLYISISFPVDFRFVLLFLEKYNMFMVYNHLKTFIYHCTCL